MFRELIEKLTGRAEKAFFAPRYVHGRDTTEGEKRFARAVFDALRGFGLKANQAQYVVVEHLRELVEAARRGDDPALFARHKWEYELAAHPKRIGRR